MNNNLKEIIVEKHSEMKSNSKMLSQNMSYISMKNKVSNVKYFRWITSYPQTLRGTFLELKKTRCRIYDEVYYLNFWNYFFTNSNFIIEWEKIIYFFKIIHLSMFLYTFPANI